MPDALIRPGPFVPRAAAAELEDLRARLRAVRWPDAPGDVGWALGTDLDYLRELVGYWADGFDWAAQEAALGRLPRFRTPVGGVAIHFVHARAAQPGGRALPLVLCHGWPDSFWRYTKVIPLLTAPVFTGARSELAPEDRAFLDRVAAWGAAEGAYSAMHRTKPQTAAFGLTDSPVGLAAWIVEKLRAWSDCGGDVERRFSKDEILTNVTLYWLTGTIGSSMRMYHANAAIPPAQHPRRVEVPSGFSLFPGDISHPPRSWLERTANVVRVNELDRGGHFAPFEEPELYAAELREFFRPYRTAAG